MSAGRRDEAGDASHRGSWSCSRALISFGEWLAPQQWTPNGEGCLEEPYRSSPSFALLALHGYAVGGSWPSIMCEEVNCRVLGDFFVSRRICPWVLVFAQAVLEVTVRLRAKSSLAFPTKFPPSRGPSAVMFPTEFSVSDEQNRSSLCAQIRRTRQRQQDPLCTPVLRSLGNLLSGQQEWADAVMEQPAFLPALASILANQVGANQMLPRRNLSVEDS